VEALIVKLNALVSIDEERKCEARSGESESEGEGQGGVRVRGTGLGRVK
jgi:hypothetical protein